MDANGNICTTVIKCHNFFKGSTIPLTINAVMVDKDSAAMQIKKWDDTELHCQYHEWSPLA